MLNFAQKVRGRGLEASKAEHLYVNVRMCTCARVTGARVCVHLGLGVCGSAHGDLRVVHERVCLCVSSRRGCVLLCVRECLCMLLCIRDCAHTCVVLGMEIKMSG